MQSTVLIQTTAHRGTVCTFVRQKYQKRGGFRNAPSTSEGSALRKPRAKQGNRFLAHRLPSTARRRTPARCCARCLAYAPAIKSPARYRAGRSKQHNPARNVKPFLPRGSPGRAAPVPLSGQSFCAARSTMPRGASPAFSSSPWPGLPISCPAYAPTTTSPARYRAGRSKQHNHARNVKPLPPSEESGENPPRAGGGEGGHLPVPLAFFASFWQKKEETPFLYAL